MPPSTNGNSKAAHLFSISFGAFFCLGFFISPNPLWAILYYAIVIPIFLTLCWNSRRALGFDEPLVFVALSVTLWFGLTVIWGVDETKARVIKYIIASIMSSSLVFIGYHYFRYSSTENIDRFFKFITFSAAANALFCIVKFFWKDPSVGERLAGWAETRHEILGANVMAVVLVFALRTIREEKFRNMKIVYVVCALLMATFIVLTGSRGPLIVLFGISLLFFRPRIMISFSLVLCALLAALYIGYEFDDGTREIVTQKLLRNPYRFEIWKETIALVVDRPLFGYGVANVHSFGSPLFTFPHSLYMSALYYGGAMGLALVLVLFGVTVFRAASCAKIQERRFLLSLIAVPILAGITDIGQIIKAPSEEWYIVWLPIVTVLGFSRRYGLRVGADVPDDYRQRDL